MAFVLVVFCACQVAKSKWEDGSRRLENSAKVFESGGGADDKEEDEDQGDEAVRALRKDEEEQENRRRQEIYRGKEHWADDIR
ncbi:MAG: hypothetical protein P1V97_30560 [Planctomycetota bacterium]|nr:hypothetical protein [Planctomycetota bacterium]